MASTTQSLSPRQIRARRQNAQKSTGPRTAAGKRRAALNALKSGIYAKPQRLAETMMDLGEDPREFQCFLAGLMEALEPADAVEQMLAEDIGMLAWKKRRLERAQTGLQLRNLEKLGMERRRQALQVGRDSADVLQAEVIKTGLRRSAKSPAKFGEILSFLHMLEEAVNKNDFSEDADPIFAALYGEEPTLRGAQIIHLYHRFQNEEEPDAPEEKEEDQELLAGLRMAIQQEIRDVVEEYMLYLQENVEVSRALHDATLAPSNPEWRTMIRQEYTLDRMMERKLKLLAKMQSTRKAREHSSEDSENGVAVKKKNSFFQKRS